MGRLNVKVVPGSSRDQIVGRLDDALKIKVMAPPEKGRANKAFVELLSMKHGRSLTSIALDLGFSSQSHFTRLFSGLTGMTPGKYQKSVKRTVG